MNIPSEKLLEEWQRPLPRLLDWICCDEGHGMMVIEASGHERIVTPGIPTELMCYCESCDRYRRVVADCLGENFRATDHLEPPA